MGTLARHLDKEDQKNSANREQTAVRTLDTVTTGARGGRQLSAPPGDIDEVPNEQRGQETPEATGEG